MLDKNKTNVCNFCEHAKIHKIGNEENARYNLFCAYDKNYNQIVDASVKHDSFVSCPSWCEKKKEQVLGCKLNYTQKVDLMRKFKPFLNWDEIKVNEVYHIPQIPGEERKDILVTHKTSHSLMYKVINSASNVSYSLYKSSLISIFLVKNKITQFVLEK